jgi:septal ring factor EnvC (AmiA/AmiB activator)
VRRSSSKRVALAVAALALWPRPLAPEQEGGSRREELRAVRAEIAGLEARLSELRRAARDLEGRLAEMDLEVRLQERRRAEAVAARELAAAEARAAEAAVAQLEANLAAAERALRRRLVGLYRLGRQGYLRLLLAARPGSDALQAVRIVRFLARSDRQAVDRYQQARQGLEGRRDDLVARREEVAAWTRREEERRSELVAARHRQAELLAEAERQRRSLASKAVELAGQEQRLAALFEDLLGESAVPLAGTPMQDFRGILEWPAAGPVAVGFGPRLDPRYRTRVPHNGIELKTRGGAEVRAVYPGKVLFAAPLEGYGPTAVVHHAGRVFTLYAGLGELKVAEGDVLSLGQAVGTAADRLYFEVRVENRPENPLDWLR